MNTTACLSLRDHLDSYAELIYDNLVTGDDASARFWETQATRFVLSQLYAPTEMRAPGNDDYAGRRRA